MIPNIPVLAACSLIPFLFGYVWFHPKVFGGETWYDVARLVGAERAEVSKVKVFSTLILNFLIAFGLYNLVVHQSGVFGMLNADATLFGSDPTVKAFMSKYGSSGLDFAHGAFHGISSTILVVVPILGYVTIFEKKSFKYFLIYLGFWLISFILMGGVLAQWGTVVA